MINDGTVSLIPGQSLNLETGSIDENIHDISYIEDTPNALVASNGKIAKISDEADATTCAEALLNEASSTPQKFYVTGTWYCVTTKQNHYAAVQPLGNGAFNDPLAFNFIVWA